MDPGTHDLFRNYVTQQKALGFSHKVLQREKAELAHFWRWAASDHHLTMTPDVVHAYHKHLHTLGLKPTTVRYKLVRMKRFYQWLYQRGHAAENPFSFLELTKQTNAYQRAGLSETDIKRLMASPDLSTLNGIRVRAILETFYSTGLREMELAGLTLYDLDQARGWVRVVQGKHHKDRMVPIGQRALDWIARYLNDVRPQILREPDTHHLFLSGVGRFYKHQGALSTLVRRYFNKAGITKPGACHLLRHSAASHMLHYGADIRHIQTLLGHQHLRTTQGYTLLSCRDLQRAQHRFQPWQHLS